MRNTDTKTLTNYLHNLSVWSSPKTGIICNNKKDNPKFANDDATRKFSFSAKKTQTHVNNMNNEYYCIYLKMLLIFFTYGFIVTQKHRNTHTHKHTQASLVCSTIKQIHAYMIYSSPQSRKHFLLMIRGEPKLYKSLQV